MTLDKGRQLPQAVAARIKDRVEQPLLIEKTQHAAQAIATKKRRPISLARAQLQSALDGRYSGLRTILPIAGAPSASPKNPRAWHTPACRGWQPLQQAHRLDGCLFAYTTWLSSHNLRA